MPEHPNAAMIRWALETIRTGDVEAVKAIWADDIEWHEIGREEPIRTKAELFAYLAEDSLIETDWEIHDVVGNDEHVVALTSGTASRDGRTMEYRVARVYHLRDGKVTARWELSDDTQRIADFFAEAR